jgi:hypothetical protein
MNSRGSYGAVTDVMLSDTLALLKWRCANRGSRTSEDDTLFILAAAERAMSLATNNKAAFFVSLVKGRHYGRVAAQEDRARLRWRAYRERGGPSPFMERMAGQLAEKLSMRP